MLRDYLLEHRIKVAHTEGSSSGRAPPPRPVRRPFASVRRRPGKVAELVPITLHESRHLRRSHDRRGGECQGLSTYMAHAHILITMDRYGAFDVGNEAEAAEMLNAYIERAQSG